MINERIKKSNSQNNELVINNLKETSYIESDSPLYFWHLANDLISHKQFKEALSSLIKVLQPDIEEDALSLKAHNTLLNVLSRYVNQLHTIGELNKAIAVYQEYCSFINIDLLTTNQQIKFIKLNYHILVYSGFVDIGLDYLSTKQKNGINVYQFMITQLLKFGYYDKLSKCLEENIQPLNDNNLNTLNKIHNPSLSKKLQLQSYLKAQQDKKDTLKKIDDMNRLEFNDFSRNLIQMYTSNNEKTNKILSLLPNKQHIKKIISQDLEYTKNIFVQICQICPNDLNLQRLFGINFFKAYLHNKTPNIETVNSSNIPKVFIHYWDKKNIPPDVARCINSWQKHNLEFDSITFSKQTALDFIEKHYDTKVKQYFLAASHPAMEADIFRLLYLYIKGGVYVDADEMCLRPSTFITQNNNTLLLTQANGDFYPLLQNNLIACCSNHPVINFAIKQILSKPLDDVIQIKDIVWNCGPGNLTLAFIKYIAMESTPNYTIMSINKMNHYYYGPKLNYKDSTDWWNNEISVNKQNDKLSKYKV